MLYREIMAVCSEIHTKHINTAVWAERRILHVKMVVHIVTTGGTYSDHWALDGSYSCPYNVCRPTQLRRSPFWGLC